MEYRPLGTTDLKLSALSFGASSLGQEFRKIDIAEALRCVQVALDRGMNFIDTSPFYGRGMSEILLGQVLPGIPRDRYFLGTKLGRYAGQHFDFSARRVIESVDISLERMGVDYLDIILCHDLEFVEMSQIVDETLPALDRVRQQGKVRYLGVSGYPMKMFRYVIDHYPIDVILSYNHYTLQNTMLLDLVPACQAKGIGIMNAAPFSARLLTTAPLPAWHKATDYVRQIAGQAAEHCRRQNVDIAELALQFAVANQDLATCIAGSANPQRVSQWADWAEQPLDPHLLAEVLEILQPIHDWFYLEGRPENNDPLPAKYQTPQFQQESASCG
ncbi:MAG: aldo/keto reductase [Planctomycetales bacterium]|nr:aldo/keto reductase [Planctomycetales bacterium]NIM07968.1 aldo/keto reductase [Planctomycetales bacterium]NIN07446.1 aldo/keto reductase [Planctomycetales bacterium]NIN76553.1 aldo/keto reductase [Planctomycetales bacterium]NIO33740.1 aldo/keto reductase [Planctomycetales bacterium]